MKRLKDEIQVPVNQSTMAEAVIICVCRRRWSGSCRCGMEILPCVDLGSVGPMTSSPAGTSPSRVTVTNDQLHELCRKKKVQAPGSEIRRPVQRGSSTTSSEVRRRNVDKEGVGAQLLKLGMLRSACVLREPQHRGCGQLGTWVKSIWQFQLYGVYTVGL